MVSTKENVARVKDYFKFTKQELGGFVVAVLAVGFIFSFRDWGEEQFNLIIGLKNLGLTLLVVGISFWFRLSCQKIYALMQGHKADYKVWWNGIFASVVIAFITLGRVPLVLIGGVVSSFMIRHRLGEFRYGFSNWVMGVTANWGILANLIAAIFFAIGLYFFPQSYFFNQGLILNIIMAFCALLPFPAQDGLSLFFGGRSLYYLMIFVTFLAAVLLLTKTTIGLILAIVIGTLIAIGYLLISSEKD